ncbi:MAG: restriction endonuclease subunit S [Lachnospiraceae bacterium]|nr:restriction endonuclease subunit S [Lachnospiraceae bacterium]
MKNFMQYRLDEIFDLQMGKTPARNNSAYWNEGTHKWISIGDLSGCGKYISDTKESISDRAVQESGISEIPANTVVMSFKLSIGKTAITSEPIYSNEAIMSFRDKHVTEIFPDYIYYLFTAKDWESGTNKAVMGKTLNKATLSTIKIDVPSIARQKEVAAILDKVSLIIDVRKNELQQLDTLIKARFVEMFGDLNTNPRGWDTQTFQQSTEFITDGEHSTPKRTDQGIYLLSARNVLNHSLQLEDVDYIDDEEYERIAKRVVPQEGDVLISCSGTVGRCCSIPKGLKCQMVRSVALLRFKPNIIPKFAEYMITSDYVQDQINSQKTASSQANLFQGKIAKLKGIVPPVALQEDFLKFVNQVDQSKAAVQKSLDQTQLLMDSLMQQYFG